MEAWKIINTLEKLARPNWIGKMHGAELMETSTLMTTATITKAGYLGGVPPPKKVN